MQGKSSPDVFTASRNWISSVNGHTCGGQGITPGDPSHLQTPFKRPRELEKEIEVRELATKLAARETDTPPISDQLLASLNTAITDN